MNEDNNKNVLQQKSADKIDVKNDVPNGDNKEEIKDIALESGFVLKDTIDLILSRQEYQYIYVFEKPM